MMASILYSLAILGVLLVFVEVKGHEGLRVPRSLEGQTCSPAAAGKNDTCTLAYTSCNPQTRQCECSKSVSVSKQMGLFPEVVECIPLDYVRTTGRCVPTIPDICSVLTPGAYCDTSHRNNQDGDMRCACQLGGLYPDCNIQLGAACRTNATCSGVVASSFCGNFTDGNGVCMCGFSADGKNYIPSQDNNACLPVNCAANPCHGDPLLVTCVDTNDGYLCMCKERTKGRSHSLRVEGICCREDQMPCLDLKKCISVVDQCDGNSDCADCSDEKQFYCIGSLPTDNPQCNMVRSSQSSKTSTTSKTSARIGLVPVVPVVPLASQPAVGKSTVVIPAVPVVPVSTGMGSLPTFGEMQRISGNAPRPLWNL